MIPDQHDWLPPEPMMRWTNAPAKSGYDTQMEKLTREWLKLGAKFADLIQETLDRNLEVEVCFTVRPLPH